MKLLLVILLLVTVEKITVGHFQTNFSQWINQINTLVSYISIEAIKYGTNIYQPTLKAYIVLCWRQCCTAAMVIIATSDQCFIIMIM